MKSKNRTGSGNAASGPNKDSNKTTGAAKTQVPWLEQVTASHFKWILLAMALLLAGLRVSFYSAYRDTPFYDMYLLPETDNRFFFDWAQAITGDWWQDSSLHPYHNWHKDIAKEYFKAHPEEKARLEKLAEATPGGPSAGQLLWDGWYQEKRYHQEPFYPYLLAFFQALGLDPVSTMLLLQLLLGVAGGLLLMLVTKRHFGTAAATFAGFIYLMCGILMYNEVVLLRTSWVVFLTILNAYAIDRLIDRQDRSSYILAGFVFGISYLLQSTFVLLMLAGLAAVFFQRREQVQTFARKSALLVLVFLMVLAPVVVRNLRVGAPAFSISSVGPLTFIVPNAYGSLSYASWYPQASLHTKLVEEGHQGLGEAVSVTLATHPSVWTFLKSVYMKAKALWVGYEYPNNQNYYLLRDNFGHLKHAFFDFFLIAPLAASGLLLAMYRRKRALSLYFSICFHLAIMLGFYVLARFRAPLVIAAIPFAAYLFSELVNFNKSRYKEYLSMLVLTGLMLILSYSNYSASREDTYLSGGYYRSAYQAGLADRLKSLAEIKNWSEWLRVQQAILDIEPAFIEELRQSDVRTSDERISIASFFSEVHQARKEVFEKIGDTGAAAREAEKLKLIEQFITGSMKAIQEVGSTEAERINMLRDFASASHKQKDYEKAFENYRSILAVNPDDVDALQMIGLCFLEQGGYDSSIVYNKKALSIDPDYVKSLVGLTAAYFFKQQYREAIAPTNRAVKLRPTDGDLYANLGACYTNVGQLDSALFWLRKGVSVNPTPRTYEYISNCFNAMGMRDSATWYANKIPR